MDAEFNPQRFLAAYQTMQRCCGELDQPLSPTLAILDTVASTNQHAWSLFEQPSSGPPIVIARSQTAGRGQWGRQWQSAPGGLYLSIGLVPHLASHQAAQLTLSTAWGIAQGLRTIPGKLSGVSTEIPVQLKWPNDLVLQGHKLGGILTETRVHQGQITKAVVGVGLNWANPVPATGINLQSFLATQPTPLLESLEMLAAIAVYGVLSGFQTLQVQGIDPILEAYLGLLAHRDRPIPLDGQVGEIVGIAPTGELRIQVKNLERPDSKAIQKTSYAEILIKPGTINLGYPL